MEPIIAVIAVSIAVRLFALTWSVVILWRLKDWRMSFLTLFIGLMVLRQSLTLYQLKSGDISLPATTELPGLIVSVLSFISVFFLGRILGELNRAKETRQALLDAMPDMIIRTAPDGTFLDYKAARDFPPYLPAGEFLGRKITDVMPGEIASTAMSLMSAALETGEVQRFDYSLDAGEERRDFEARIVPNKHVCTLIVRDITKHKVMEAKLAEREGFIENVFDSIQDGLSVLDRELNIIKVNPTMEKWYEGQVPLVGKKCYAAYHCRKEPCEICPSIRTLKSGKPEFDLVPYETAEGVKGAMELFTFPFVDSKTGKITGVIEYVRDITRRAKAEEDVHKLNRIYAVLSGINEAIVRIHDRERLFEEVCRIAIERGLFRLVWVGMLDKAANAVKPVARCGMDSGYIDSLNISLNPDIPEGRGPVGSAMREGTYFVSNDIERDERMIPWREEAVRRGYRSVASFPIKTGGRAIGSINLYSSEKDFFSEEEIALLREMADDISFALEFIEQDERRKAAEDDLEKRVAELEEFYDMAVGRELRMKELKGEIEKLRVQTVNTKPDRERETPKKKSAI